MEKRWLTIKDAAEYLSTSQAGVRKRLERGILQRHWLGGRIYLDKKEIDQLLESSCENTMRQVG